MQITEMKKDDFQSVSELLGYCTKSPERELSEYMQNPCSRITVAREDGRVIGFCCVLFAGDNGDIADIAVNKDYRRRGVAAMLLQELVLYCEKKRVDSLFLEVRESNLAAIRLYEKLRFEQLTVRKKYYSEPTEDALVLRREIVL